MDDDGFTVLLDRPLVEKERLENETALWTNPEDEDDNAFWLAPRIVE